MIRKLLSIMLFFAVVGMASAQKPMRQDSKMPQRMMVKKPNVKDVKALKTMKARAFSKAITVGSDQMWFGYGNDAEAGNMGLAMNADHSLAVYIPYEKIAGKGATVDGVRFMLTSAKAKNITAWVGTALPKPGNYAKGADLEVKDVAVSDVVLDGYTEVAFSKSYEIPESGLWIGFSFDIEGLPDAPDDSQVSDEDYEEWYDNVYYPWLEENYFDAYPFLVSYIDTPLEGTMLFASNVYDDFYRSYAELDPANAADYLSMVGWDDYSPYGYAVALNALIGGGKFMGNAVSVEDFGQKYALLNKEVTFPVTLTNNGKNGIQNFTYEVSINGTKVDEQTVTLVSPIENLLGKTTIDLSFPTGDQSGAQNIVLTITKVNGETNELQATAKGAIFVLSESAKMKPLVEEYTGTWCGWCTRGWVALEMLSKDFHDDAVIYAVHNGDPMEIDAFVPVVRANATGFPSLSINRTRTIDPYYGSDDSGSTNYGVKNDVEAAKADLAPAAITVKKAAWADDAKTKINIDTETKVMFDEAESSIAIGYVLVADGLSGTGRDWAQANYYAGSSNVGEDLQKLTEMDEYIIGMEFNHVAVAAWGAANGVEGSITGAVKAGEPIAGQYVADLEGLLIGTDRTSDDPDDHVTVLDLIKDKKLHVVAFLVNKVTGEVLNADEVDLSDNSGTGIMSLSEKAGSVNERYNVSGQRLTAPQKGLNIIRLTDGKTVKVLVK